MESAITSAVSTTTSQVVAIFSNNIGTVMVVFAGLVGLGIAIRLIKKFVGRKGA